jgi:hypothetical protein
MAGLGLAACGGELGDPQNDQHDRDRSGPSGTAEAFDANQQTPGYFRDTYRLLEAQSTLDDETAAARLLIILPERLAERGALPPMQARELDTLDGLLILALRAVQATGDTPRASRRIGEELLLRTLELDPARVAWNRQHPDHAVGTSLGGAATLAAEGASALRLPADGLPAPCQISSDTGTTFDPGTPETVWVEEYCEPDRTVGGYCEPDVWIDGDCTEEWVPEQCTGGYWEDDGYYEYRCSSDGTCRYIWVSRQTYVDGTCSGGYWDEWCDSGYWEYGLCYDGTFVPGYCDPGHYEFRYPGGTWNTPINAPLSPPECSTSRPSQLAIAVSVTQVLHAKAAADLAPEWQAAVKSLVASGQLQAPNEVTFDAVHQILSGAAALEP